MQYDCLDYAKKKSEKVISNYLVPCDSSKSKEFESRHINKRFTIRNI